MQKTPLTKERKGEIALAMVEYDLRRTGIKLSSQMKREVIAKAKDIKIPEGEALQFAEEMLRSLVDEVFPPDE